MCCENSCRVPNPPLFQIVKETRPVTLENILLKANLKLGGLNYEVDMNGMVPNDNVK